MEIKPKMKKNILYMKGEEQNELTENKKRKYLTQQCLFGMTKHLSFSTTIYIMRSIKPL